MVLLSISIGGRGPLYFTERTKADMIHYLERDVIIYQDESPGIAAIYELIVADLRNDILEGTFPSFGGKVKWSLKIEEGKRRHRYQGSN